MTLRLTKSRERRKCQRALLEQLSMSNETLSITLPTHYKSKKRKQYEQLPLGRRYTNKITKAISMANLIEKKNDPLRHLGFGAKTNKPK